MAVTKSDVGLSGSGKTVNRFNEASSANTALTATVGPGQSRRLLQITVAYSATPVQTGVIVEIDSGAGAAYDCQLAVGAANARYTAYIPDSEIIIGKDDAIKVTAPAAGGAITSAIAIYAELT